MKTAMAFGTFDLLHPGHLRYLKYAKQKHDKLIVVVARDESVKKIKGRTTHFNEHERQQILAALKVVDLAILGDKKDFLKVIEKYTPDTLVLGYDQNVSELLLKKQLEKRGLHPAIRRAPAFNPDTHKSSIYKEKILAQGKD